MATSELQKCSVSPLSVDVPGDLFYAECVLTGRKYPPKCKEYENVEKFIGRDGIERILCPPGCVTTTEDVERKCGIIYEQHTRNLGKEGSDI